MDTEQIVAHLSRIEAKLDNHLERLSKAETSIEWLKGHLKIAMAFVMTSLTGVVAALYNTMKH